MHYFLTCFFMKLFLVRCLVKVQVTSKYFIWTFSRKYHFHSQGFNFSGHKKHCSTCSDSRYIICFNMVNDFFKCIYTFLIQQNKRLLLSGSKKLIRKKQNEETMRDDHLNCEIKFMVTSTKIICYLFCSFQVRRTLNGGNVRSWSR